MASQYKYEVAMLMEFEVANQPSTPLETRYWTGQGELDFDAGSGTQTWHGTTFNENSLVSLSPLQSTTGSIPQRVQGRIIIGELADLQRHAALERDLGPLPVDIHLIFKNTAGTWTRLRTFEGRTGESGLINGDWNFTVEQRDHDRDRKEERVVSHETLYARKFEYGSGNTKRTVRNARGLEFLQSLVNNKQIKWPV